ncbi:MAG: AMP-binding protein [Candidatus Manganitrophus sp.]|nr:MAG: AMP-binding protein [Candidatus Manganitrophus sp.]
MSSSGWASGRATGCSSLAGRIPELYIAALGTLKKRSLFWPLFSAFGPEPIAARMAIGGARVLVTTDALYRRKVAGLRDLLPDLEQVILVGEEGKPTDVHDTHDLPHLMPAASDHFTIGPTDPEDLALLHFTSGTTGTPKGALHVHEAVVAHYVTGQLALDLHADDVFWCTADPGWVTGTSYGIIAPLLHGVTSIVDEAEFDAERWYGILHEQQVTVWYTAPTAIRMLMKAGLEPLRKYDFRALRFIASVGEPLNPEAVGWGQSGLRPADPRQLVADRDRRHHDRQHRRDGHQARLDGPAAARRRGGDRPAPRAGAVAVVDAPGVQGELALRPGWPSMFRGYLEEPERYRKCFAGGWYLTGDLARRDADGYFWFVGRADDVIKSAGHLIGPFEVESVLMEHPAVAEAGVIGKPDPVAREVVKAFVSLKPGHEPSEALRRELLAHARTRLGAAVAPKEIDFRPALPRTRSGKIMRRLLKARELGLPEGRHLDAGGAWSHDIAVETTRWRCCTTCCASAGSRRSRCAQLYSARKNPRLPAPVHRRGGGRRRRHAGAAAGRRHGRHLPRARPCAGARRVDEPDHGRDVRQAKGCSPRPRRLDAPVRRRPRASTAATPSSAAACRWPSGWRWPTRCGDDPRVTACFFGEGAVAEGAFHESLNLAALWRLPVLFVCENNLYAMGTALDRHQSQTDIDLESRRLRHGHAAVDGMDLLAVHEATRRAVEAIRVGGRARSSSSCAPTASAPIRCSTPSSTATRPRSRRWKQRDPIDTFTARLQRRAAAPRPSSRRWTQPSRPRWPRRSPSPRPVPGSRSTI